MRRKIEAACWFFSLRAVPLFALFFAANLVLAQAPPAAAPPGQPAGEAAKGDTADVSAAASNVEPLNSKAETDPCASFKKLYTELTEDAAASKLSSEVTQARLSPAGTAKQQAIRDYYTKAFFPRFTQCEKQGEFQAYRKKLMSEIAACKNQGTHDLIVEVALENAKKLFEGRFARSTKINALLIMGSLHSKEAVNAGGAITPAVPYPPALPVLLAVASDEKNDSDYRIAASVGLVEHAKSLRDKTDDKNAQNLYAFALAVLTNAKKPSAAESAGYWWLKSQGAEIVGHLGTVGAKKEAIEAIQMLADDKEVPMNVRVFCAKTLGFLPLSQAKQVSATQLAKVLGRLLVSSYETEKSRVLSASGQGISPAALKFYAVSIGQALRGPSAATGTTPAAKLGLQSMAEGELKQANFAQLLEIYTEWEKVFDEKNLDSSKMEQQLEVLKIKTDRWLRS